MPVRDIRTRLTIEGEKELRKELDAAAREMRVLESGMKAVAAGFDATDNKYGKLEASSKSLHSMLAQQEEITKALAQAVKDSTEKYGKASEETDGWTIKLNKALTKQEELRKAMRNADRELDEFARDSAKAGRELENGLGDAAEDTRRSLAQMYDEMKSGIDDIRGSVGVSAAFDIGGGIVDLAQGLDSFAEGSRDYRRRLAFLKQNAETAGLDYNEIMNQYYEISGLTGESDGAIEGLSNLIAAGLDIHEVAAAVDELGGAVIRFPDTMKFESLAESLQETIATRTATGQYAELLGRLGVDLNTFNTAMGEAKTAEEAQQVALSFLANNGLKQTYEGFTQTNEGLVKAEEASRKLETAISELGGVVDEKMAPIKDTLAEVTFGLTDWLSGEEKIMGFTREEFLKELQHKSGGAVGYSKEDEEIIRNDWKEAFQNIWEGLGNLFGGGGEDAATEAMTAMQDTVAENAATVGADFYAAGEGMMLQMAGGIAAGTGAAVGQMQASMRMLAGMSAVPLTGRIDYVPSHVQVGAQLASATVNLDGKQVGKAMLPVINGMMGTQAIQAETYGE